MGILGLLKSLLIPKITKLSPSHRGFITGSVVLFFPVNNLYILLFFFMLLLFHLTNYWLVFLILRIVCFFLLCCLCRVLCYNGGMSMFSCRVLVLRIFLCIHYIVLLDGKNMSTCMKFLLFQWHLYLIMLMNLLMLIACSLGASFLFCIMPLMFSVSMNMFWWLRTMV